MFVVTILGILVGLGVIAVGVGEIERLWGSMYSLLIVGVGGIAATVVAFPLSTLNGISGALSTAIFGRSPAFARLIERIVGMAETARREGILALENEPLEDNKFLQQGVRLAVDGTEPALIMDIMETELMFVEERHKQMQRLLDMLGRNWLIFGGVTIAALFIVRDGLTGMALVRQVAYPAFQALLLAGLIAWPLARKLGELSGQEILFKRMIIEGIMAVQAGDNPRIVEHKLSVFLLPKDRPEGKPAPRPEPGPVDDGTAERVAEFVAGQREQLARMVRKYIDEHEGNEEQKQKLEELIGRLERGELGVEALLAALSNPVRGEILAALKNPPTPLLERGVEAGDFDFADIVRLTDGQIQFLLREIDHKDLVVAMKGASEEVREKFLSNMSERVRTFINEEMGFVHPQPEEVLDTQARVVQQVLMHAKKGELELPDRG